MQSVASGYFNFVLKNMDRARKNLDSVDYWDGGGGRVGGKGYVRPL